MSGFDNSQPVTDEAVLSNDENASDKSEEKKAPANADAAEADELGDATPGPR